jgi:hypothetical protein
MAHHDALAVVLHDQQHVRGGGSGAAAGVEGVDAGRGGAGELLGLSLAQDRSRGPADRLACGFERAAGGLDRIQPAQAVGVLFLREVQGRVGGVQVRRARRPVRDPGHRHLAEHRGQGTAMPGLGAGPRDPVRAGHLPEAGFPGRPQVQVVLEQLAQQLPAVGVQQGLQLGGPQPGCLFAAEPARHHLEPLPRRREAVPGRGHGRPPLRPARRARSAASPASAALSSSARARS